MYLLLLAEHLSPAQMARNLNENFGYSIGPAVITKWDRLILKKERHRKAEGDKLSRRSYGYVDMILFNGIAVMRNLGYSIDDIKKVFDMGLRDSWTEKECSAFIDSVKAKIANQKKGLELYDKFFDELKRKHYVPGTKEEPVFKPATPEEIPKRKNQVPVGQEEPIFKAATPEQIAKRKEQP